MKKYVFISIILTIFLFGCKNEERKLLLQQQELLELSMISKTAYITIFYENNKVKYEGLKKFENDLFESYRLVKEDFNKNAVEILSLYKELGYGYQVDKLASDIKIAKDKNDKNLKIYLINKYLILLDELLHREIIKYTTRGFHFTNIEPNVKLDKNIYKVGDRVTANIFVKAYDTTQLPILLVHNNVFIDSFNNKNEGVYSIIATEKGKFEVNGKIIYQIGGTSNIDSSSFKFEYIVK